MGKIGQAPAGCVVFSCKPLRLCGSLFFAIFIELVNHRVVGCVCVPLQPKSSTERKAPRHLLLADGMDALFAEWPLSSHWLEANATGAGGSPDLAEDERRTDMESHAETRRRGGWKVSKDRPSTGRVCCLFSCKPLRLCVSAGVSSLPVSFIG